MGCLDQRASPSPGAKRLQREPMNCTSGRVEAKQGQFEKQTLISNGRKFKRSTDLEETARPTLASFLGLIAVPE